MTTLARVCKECGTPLAAGRKPKTFCSTKCRQDWNNRRLERGAMIGDLFMTMRYERELSNDLGVWAIMCRLAKEFREEDIRDRGSRKSWQSARAVLDKLPVVMVEKDVTIIRSDFSGRARAKR